IAAERYISVAKPQYPAPQRRAVDEDRDAEAVVSHNARCYQQSLRVSADPVLNYYYTTEYRRFLPLAVATRRRRDADGVLLPFRCLTA
ncbi:hypothetical protein, partial [Halorubrum sp. C191]|uniref:hypothetical protein n=1 Tax=Halorubrum sp. C191 TaxID=1383842 RepID=UPI001A7E0FE6